MWCLGYSVTATGNWINTSPHTFPSIKRLFRYGLDGLSMIHFWSLNTVAFGSRWSKSNLKQNLRQRMQGRKKMLDRDGTARQIRTRSAPHCHDMRRTFLPCTLRYIPPLHLHLIIEQISARITRGPTADTIHSSFYDSFSAKVLLFMCPVCRTA